MRVGCLVVSRVRITVPEPEEPQNRAAMNLKMTGTKSRIFFGMEW
jgi:hypothetical protein